MSSVRYDCPHCGTALQPSAGGQRPGALACPRCVGRFSGAVQAAARPSPAPEADFASFRASPLSARRQRPRPAGAGGSPLWPVLRGILLGIGLLLVGGAIAWLVQRNADGTREPGAAAPAPKPDAGEVARVEKPAPPRIEPEVPGAPAVAVADPPKPARPEPKPLVLPRKEEPVPVPKEEPVVVKKEEPAPRPVVVPPPKKAEAPDLPRARPMPVPVVLARETLPPAMQAQVDAAIARGVAHLKTTFATGKLNLPLKIAYPKNVIALSHPGIPALVGLTLLHCGVPRDDPVVKRAAVLTRANGPKLTHSYSLAASILFLDALGEPKDDSLIRHMALQMVAGQNAWGGWGYTCPQLTRGQRDQLLGFLKAPLGTAVPSGLRNLTAAHYRPDKPWRLPDSGRPGLLGDDNSNTQFALMAVWVARRHGIPMDRTLGLAAVRFRSSQLADGSWGYRTWDERLREASSCAGLLGLALGYGSGPRPDHKLSDDRVVRGGLAFLAACIDRGPLRDTKPPGDLSITVKKVPVRVPVARGPLARGVGRIPQRPAQAPPEVKAVRCDLYFLWSLERVAVIYNLAKINGRNWYSWGAAILLARQRPDGSWFEAYGVPDTCFALLFLKRANLASDLTTRIYEVDEMVTSRGADRPADETPKSDGADEKKPSTE